MTTPNCPKCKSVYIYADGPLWVCPECSHEWPQELEDAPTEESASSSSEVKDAHGNILQDGDTVTVIKDLKVKGSSSPLKAGTKIKKIRLIDEVDGHNIGCKIEGFGAMNLKSEFVKKV